MVFTKPPAGAQIAWGHPLANGLIGAYLANEGSGLALYDTVTGSSPLTITDNLAVWEGDVLRLPNGTYVSGNLTNYVAGRPISVVIAVQNYAAVGGSLFCVGDVQANNQLLHVRAASTTSLTYAHYNNDLTVSGLPNSDNTKIHIVGTMDAQLDQNLYMNGAKIGNRTSTAPLSANGAVIIAKMPGGSAFTQSFIHAYIYDRALTAEDVAFLYANPYAPIRPRVIKSYFLPFAAGYSGSGSPTIGAFTSSATGNVGVSGTSAATIPAFTSAATGTLTFQGTISKAIDAFIGAIVGFFTIQGSGSPTISDFIPSAVGTFAQNITGTISALIGAFIASMSGTFTSNIAEPETETNLPRNVAVIVQGDTNSNYIAVNATGYTYVFVENFNATGSLQIQGSLDGTTFFNITTNEPQAATPSLFFSITAPSGSTANFVTTFSADWLFHLRYIRFVASSAIVSGNCRITCY